VTENVRYRQEGPVLVVTLARPKRLNALDAAMVTRLRELVVEGSSDPQVGAMLLEAEGRAFCAGQDLAERSRPPGSPPPDLGESLGSRYNPLVRAMRASPTPVVAAVQGVAAGAGADLAFAADIIVAADDARFAVSFARVGLLPDAGGTWLLTRSVGRARALGLALLGSTFDAETARVYGLVRAVVPASELAAGAIVAARSLAGATPHEEAPWS